MSYIPKSFGDYSGDNEEILRKLLMTPGLSAAQARIDILRQRIDEEARQRRVLCDNCDSTKLDSHVCQPKYDIPRTDISGWESLGMYMGVGHL